MGRPGFEEEALRISQRKLSNPRFRMHT
jgi:hypothetical protein